MGNEVKELDLRKSIRAMKLTHFYGQPKNVAYWVF